MIFIQNLMKTLRLTGSYYGRHRDARAGYSKPPFSYKTPEVDSKSYN
jgi:hypothetical protein